MSLDHCVRRGKTSDRNMYRYQGSSAHPVIGLRHFGQLAAPMTTEGVAVLEGGSPRAVGERTLSGAFVHAVTTAARTTTKTTGMGTNDLIEGCMRVPFG
jgi:hypothetical protein